MLCSRRRRKLRSQGLQRQNNSQKIRVVPNTFQWYFMVVEMKTPHIGLEICLRPLILKALSLDQQLQHPANADYHASLLTSRIRSLSVEFSTVCFQAFQRILLHPEVGEPLKYANSVSQSQHKGHRPIQQLLGLPIYEGTKISQK